MFQFLKSILLPPQSDAKPVAGALGETSMNFDSENVRPFLETLNANEPGLISSSTLERVDDMLRTMRVDDTESLALNPQVGLQLEIFMDDYQAPDLYFTGPMALIDRIDQIMIAFMNALGL